MPVERAELWAQLLKRGSLKPKRDTPLHQGRVDLRGVAAESPRVTAFGLFDRFKYQEVSGEIHCRGVKWRGIDFSGSQLGHIAFFDSLIEDCVFDDADCVDWGLWNTKVINCSFRRTDLTGAALGGLTGVLRNSFRGVRFEESNLIDTAHGSAEFVDCEFIHCRLDGVSFAADTFERCRFAGALREVQFYDRDDLIPAEIPHNEMKDVDFRDANLRHVEFRGLDMDHVQWPRDERHILLVPYRQKLHRALDAIKDWPETPDTRALKAYLNTRLKWAGPNQRAGVLHRRDLEEAASPADAPRLIRLLQEDLSLQ